MNDYDTYDGIDDAIVEEALAGILQGWWDTEDSALEGCTVRTFADAGLLTRDRGLTLRLPNGSEFQITIVQR